MLNIEPEMRATLIENGWLPPPPPTLTPREREAYNYKLAGQSAARTAKLMEISVDRVKTLRRKAMKKVAK